MLRKHQRPASRYVLTADDWGTEAFLAQAGLFARSLPKTANELITTEQANGKQRHDNNTHTPQTRWWYPQIVNKNLPLQAEIRKYPQSVMSLKSRCTTGRVWPLQVSGTCRRFAIVCVCGVFFFSYTLKKHTTTQTGGRWELLFDGYSRLAATLAGNQTRTSTQTISRVYICMWVA